MDLAKFICVRLFICAELVFAISCASLGSGFHDGPIACTATKIAGEGIVNLGAIRVGDLFVKREERHDDVLWWTTTMMGCCSLFHLPPSPPSCAFHRFNNILQHTIIPYVHSLLHS